MSEEEARMTARDRLLWQLRNPGLVGLDEFEAEELIGNYAAELAWEIRATRDDMAGTVEPEFLDGMSYAANGIAPHVYERPGEEPNS